MRFCLGCNRITFKGIIDYGGGFLNSAAQSYDIFVVRYDAAGNAVWGRRFGDSQTEFTGDVAFDPLGAPVIVGTFNATLDFGQGPLTSSGQNEAFVAKLNP